MSLPATFSNAAAVTPSDTVNFTFGNASGLYVGGAGNVVVVTLGNQVITFVGVVAGTTLYVKAKRVNATNTTATNIVALY